MPTEPLLRVVTRSGPEAFLSPADLMLQPLLRTFARSMNLSVIAYMQGCTGLSRSQLHQGVRRASTLNKAARHAINRASELSGLSSGEVQTLFSNLPAAGGRAGWQCFVYFSFLGIGDPGGAMEIAERIDKLIFALEDAFQAGEPASILFEQVLASGLFARGVIEGTGDQLVAGFSEAETLSACRASKLSWRDAMPLLAILLHNLLLTLVAAIDLQFSALCLHTDVSKAECSLYELFPLASSRMRATAGIRRNAVEKPMTRLLDMTAKILHVHRYGAWPKRRVKLATLIAWAGVPTPPLAKWRSGEKPLTIRAYQDFFAAAAKRRSATGRRDPAPMLLYLVAALLETIYVQWRKPGKPAQVLLIAPECYQAYQCHAAELMAFRPR